MKIIGTGSALPRKVVANADLEGFLDTTDEWIVSRTGIRSRHVISDERLEDLGRDAALKALADAGKKPEDIDLLLCSNVVNEYMTPGLGCIIAAAIGLRCPCIDINCACPGFIYALDIADSYFKVGKVKNVLIVCAEEPTRMTSWQDRATCVLFGDGAGAVVLSEGEGVRAVRIGARPDPDKIWQFRPLEPTPFVTKTESGVPLQMQGREVFRFAGPRGGRPGRRGRRLLHDPSGEPPHRGGDPEPSRRSGGEVPDQYRGPWEFLVRFLSDPAGRVQAEGTFQIRR